jgi:hypothetical protein
VSELPSEAELDPGFFADLRAAVAAWAGVRMLVVTSVLIYALHSVPVVGAIALLATPAWPGVQR